MHTLKSGVPVGVLIPIVGSNPLFASILLLITGEEVFSPEIIILTLFIIVGVILVTYEKSASENAGLGQVINMKALAAGLTAALLMGLMIYIEIVILKHDAIEGFSYSTVKIFGLGLIGSIPLLLTGSKSKLKDSFSNSNISYSL